MRFGHIFHDFEHSLENDAIHTGEGIIEHYAISFVAGILWFSREIKNFYNKYFLFDGDKSDSSSEFLNDIIIHSELTENEHELLKKCSEKSSKRSQYIGNFSSHLSFAFNSIPSAIGVP